MLRAVVLVVLVCCGQKTVPPVGLTQATAIVVPLSVKPDQIQPALTSSFDPMPASRAPRWFVVTLPANEKRTFAVSVLYRGAERSVDLELLDPAGHVLAHADAGTHGQYDRSGARTAWLGETRGTQFIRVTTQDGAVDYVLNVSSTVVTPKPKEWAPCNPFVYDTENPRCKGIVACDPNKPVTTNPSCCQLRCVGGECTGTLARITAEDGYAWFSTGARAGVTTWYHGEAELTLIGGTRKLVNIHVVEVERERSKVLLSVYDGLDLSHLDGTVARLRPWAQCGK